MVWGYVARRMGQGRSYSGSRWEEAGAVDHMRGSWHGRKSKREGRPHRGRGNQGFDEEERIGYYTQNEHSYSLTYRRSHSRLAVSLYHTL
jgi:hypothetical protein